MAYQNHLDLSADKAFVLGAEGFPKQIEGHYLGARDIEGQYGVAKLHIFNTQEGSVGIWGKTSLNAMLPTHLGQKCLVTFIGMSKPKKGRRPAYLYQLKYDPQDLIDTQGITLTEGSVEGGDVEEEQEEDFFPHEASQTKPTSKIKEILEKRKAGASLR